MYVSHTYVCLYVLYPAAARLHVRIVPSGRPPQTIHPFLIYSCAMSVRQAKRSKRAGREDVAGAARGRVVRDIMATKHLNWNTLQSVLKVLRANPEVMDVNREDGMAALEGLFASVRRTETLTLKDGTTFHWDFADPNLLLARTLRESAALRRLYVDALARHPCSMALPWSLIVIFDEFTPGSIAHPQLERTTMNLAFNFLEIGAQALSTECTWLIPVLVRGQKVKNAVGGWSACLAMYLRAHLLGDLSIQRVGVSFRDDGGGCFTIWARLRVLCSDGEGLQHALDIKGPNGIRPCVRCQNVLRKGSGLAHRRPNFVEVTCADHKKFIKSTPADLDAEVASVLDAWRLVALEAMTATAAKERETSTGINANPCGLLADASLRTCFSVVEVLNEDWMHGALQDGVLFIIIQLLLQAVTAKMGWGLERVESFLYSDWQFPKAMRGKMRGIWRMFDARAREHMDERIKFKYVASELLGLYVLLRHFILAVVVPAAAAMEVDLRAEIGVFLAYCTVIDCIMKLKKGYASEPDAELLIRQLEATLDRAMELQMHVFGPASFRPKHHRMQHIANQIRDFGVVIDAFIIERLHLVLKDVLKNVHNPHIFETSLLRNCMARQIKALNDHAAVYGLVGKTAPLDACPGATAAQDMRFCGMRLASGDVVLRAGVAGEITLCATEGDRCFVIVNVWSEAGVVTAYSRRWQKTDSHQAWPAEDVEPCLAWYTEEGGSIIALETCV